MSKIFEKYEEFRQIAEPVAEVQHKEAELDMLFFHGKSSALTLGMYTEEGTRAIVNINHIKSVIDPVNGLFRQIRRGLNYSARQGEKAERLKLSETMSRGMKALLQNADMDILESDQDLMMLMTGIAPMEIALHFRDDPQGSLIGENIDPRLFYHDVSATDRNLRSAGFQYYHKCLDLDTALNMFEGAEPEDFESGDPLLQGKPSSSRDRRAKYPVKKPTPDKNERPSSVYVTPLQWRELEKVNIYHNPAFLQRDPVAAMAIQQALFMTQEEMQTIIEQSGDYQEGFELDFDPSSEMLIVPQRYAENVENVLAYYGGEKAVRHDSRDRWCYYTAFMGRTDALKSFKSIDQSGYTVKVKTGNYDHESRTWYGMVRPMREPALYLSKTMTEMLLILAKRAKGGVVFETDAVQDASEFEEKWAQTDAAVEVNNIDGIKPKNEGAMPTGYEGLYTTFAEMPMKSVGLNMEFLGQSDKKGVSGILEQQRIRQVTSVLACYTDSITLFDRDKGRLGLTYVRYLTKINKEFIIEIGADPDEALKLTREIADIDYSIELGEAQLSPIMKESKYTAIKDLATIHISTTGNPILLTEVADTMDVFGFSKQEIERIKEKLQPPPPDPAAAQLQQQAMMAELENKTADTDVKRADTQKKTAEANKIANEAGVNPSKTVAETGHIHAQTEKTIREAAMVGAEPVNQPA